MSETSLKIKIPPKGAVEAVTKTASISRKAAKRRISSDDDEYEAKPTVDVKITAKNQSKPALPSATAHNVKKRRRVEEDIDVDITTVAPPVPAPAPVPDDPPPKKKLPTIKKHKKTDSTATSAAASPAPLSAALPKFTAKPNAGTSKLPAPSVVGLPKKPQAPVQATTMNPSGTGDFDLREPGIWKSLIGKGSSNSGPKVGIEKRISTEERRKQLDKLRDEARLEREQQTRETFDLQAQSRKITAFEKKMHHEHNVRINGPHYLGAAFIVRPIPGMRPR